MRYNGREIDCVALWENYVQFPNNADFSDKYFPKVQCPNPQHDTMKRHFQINADDGLVHCFAHCGISGTFVHAIQMIEGCNEREAQRILLRYSRFEKTNNRRSKTKSKFDSRADAIVPDLSFSGYIPPAGLEYLSARGINGSSVAKWELGWNDDELRIVIPVKDEKGQIRFLIRRATKDSQQPKYLYTEGVSKTSLLFGALTVSPRDDIVIVEGSLDAIRLHQHGLKAVATLGTGISEQQLRILENLRPRRIYLMMDRDVAGIKGIEILTRKVKNRYPLYVCRYPENKFDPAELSQREAYGSIDRAVTISKWKKLCLTIG